MKRIIAIITFSVLLSSAGCATKLATQVTVPPDQPAASSITPEQQFALAKIGAQTAATIMGTRIADLEQKPTTSPNKLRVLKAIKGVLDEFNNQVADVTVIDLSSREKVRGAIDKALNGADNLAKKDVLEIKDAKVQADINAVIEALRGALKSFNVFFPDETKPAQQ